MFIEHDTNVDYLIPYVRLHMGDTADVPVYSDTIIRTSIISSVKMLQRRWNNRYMVYSPSILADATGVEVPSGYVYAYLPEGAGFIPSGLGENDVYRNPHHTFADAGNTYISQNDETPVILTASITLRKSQLTSSSDSFQTWSDGEFSFSNVASSRIQSSLLDADMLALETYFKQRLAGSLRSSFQWNSISRY